MDQNPYESPQYPPPDEQARLSPASVAVYSIVVGFIVLIVSVIVVRMLNALFFGM